MVKHTQTIRQQQLTNCLSVFDHFKGLALKGLRLMILGNKENIGKISKLHGDIAYCPVSPAEINFWRKRSKNTQNQISNASGLI